jgi:hypothetical protein
MFLVISRFATVHGQLFFVKKVGGFSFNLFNKIIIMRRITMGKNQLLNIRHFCNFDPFTNGAMSKLFREN